MIKSERALPPFLLGLANEITDETVKRWKTEELQMVMRKSNGSDTRICILLIYYVAVFF